MTVRPATTGDRGWRRLVAGPPGSGKTRLALEVVRRAAVDLGLFGAGAPSPGQALVVLPNYEAVEHARRIALSRWGARGLFDEVFTTFTGVGERYLPRFRVGALPTAEQRDRLMVGALRAAAVPLFEPLAASRSFRARLLRLVKEWKQSGIEPQELVGRIGRANSALDGEGRPRAEGFLRVFAAYSEALVAADLLDHEDVLRKLAGELAERQHLAVAQLLVVDGFDDLTPVESRILDLLIERVAGGNVFATVAWDDARSEWFPSGALWRQQLLARGFTEETLPPSGRPAPLDRLARDLFVGPSVGPSSGTPPAPPTLGGAHVATIVAADREAEAEAVARLLRREQCLAADRDDTQAGGTIDPTPFRWHGVGIVLRDVARDGPLWTAALQRHDIPVRTGRALESLGHAPLVRAARGALAMLAGEDEAGTFDVWQLHDWLAWCCGVAEDEALQQAFDPWQAGLREDGWPADFKEFVAGAPAELLPWLSRLAAARVRLQAAAGASTVPDGVVPDSAVGDSAVGDSAVGDSAAPDGSVADGSVGDGTATNPAVNDKFARTAATPAGVLAALLPSLLPLPRHRGFAADGSPRDATHDAWLAAAASARRRVLAAASGLASPPAADLPRVGDDAGVAPPPDAATAVANLLAAIESAGLPRRDRRLDAVTLLDPESARTWELDLVVVAGLSGDGFPRRHREDPILLDGERDALAQVDDTLRLPRARDRDIGERRLFLAALGAARRELWLSRAGRDGRGDTVDPSPFWAAIHRCVTPRQLFNDVRMGRVAPDPELAISARDRQFVHEPVDRVRRPWVARAAAEMRGDSMGLPAASTTSRYGDSVARTSASSLERGHACAARHGFARVFPVPDAELRFEGPVFEPTDMGRLLHDAFHLALSHPDWDERRVVAGAFEAGDLETTTEPTVFDEVLRCVALLRARELARRDKFQPVVDWLELKFDGAKTPWVDAANTPFQLGGRIDRVDAGDEGLVVVDYKSSALGCEEARKATIAGSGLQLPLYALVLEAQESQPVVALEWVAMRSPARELVVDARAAKALAGREEGRRALVLEHDVFRELLARAARTAGQFVADVRAGRLARAPLEADLCNDCSYARICRPSPAYVQAAVAARASAIAPLVVPEDDEA